MGIAKKASKTMKGKSDERYMNGHPTRLEVANYVNALMEEKYVPMFQSMIQMSAMVIQGILIEKSICTGEELETITKQFMEEQEKRMAATKTINSTELLKEVLTPDYVKNMSEHLDDIKANKMGISDTGVVERLANVYSQAVSAMRTLVDKTAILTDFSRENILKGLVDIKRQIESGEILIANSIERSRVLGMLWDAIIPFAHKHLGTFAKYGDSIDYKELDIISKVNELIDMLEEQGTISDISALKDTVGLLETLHKSSYDKTILIDKIKMDKVKNSLLSIQNDWINGTMKDNPNKNLVVGILVRAIKFIDKYNGGGVKGESSVASDSIPAGNA